MRTKLKPRKEPGIAQDYDGFWWVDKTIGGKRIQRRAGRSKSDARELLSMLEDQARRKRLFPEEVRAEKSRISIAELVARYEEEATNNLRSYKRVLYFRRLWVEFLGPNTNIRDIEPAQVEAYKAERLRAGLSPTTVNKEVKALKRLYNLAVEDGLLKANPLARVKNLRQPSWRLRWLSEDEEARLKAECDPELWRLIEIAFLSGLRQGEQRNMTRDQVNLKANFLHVPDRKNSGRTELPMGRRLRAAVEAQLELGTPWLCPNRTRTNRIDKSTLYNREFMPAVRRAGIEDFTWHDLRHTFCSRLVMRGARLPTVKELAGHKNIEQTSRYVQLSPGHLNDAMRLLDE